MIKCGFCGYNYYAEEAESACKSCPMAAGGCRLVRCPRCGYEALPEAKLVSWIRSLWNRWQQKRSRAADTQVVPTRTK